MSKLIATTTILFSVLPGFTINRGERQCPAGWCECMDRTDRVAPPCTLGRRCGAFTFSAFLRLGPYIVACQLRLLRTCLRMLGRHDRSCRWGS
ncbi:hypothetical protein PR003_g30352 [Phytophthora rubi]|uniref:Secreted protein n=1 Tax=Phytophthora rubi TaxID=129364 RepID=A0A6A3HXL4_9STRA|nr:hypothetical protein PR002_g26182 [Phytophthora rubi]KAE8980072.1 hypothetical protein PR001_g24374 [Phytophthora rubi]KAE9271963.1 hypothetical protein PR003_g30352 [Phytophthora rubi]